MVALASLALSLAFTAFLAAQSYMAMASMGGELARLSEQASYWAGEAGRLRAEAEFYRNQSEYWRAQAEQLASRVEKFERERRVVHFRWSNLSEGFYVETMLDEQGKLNATLVNVDDRHGYSLTFCVYYLSDGRWSEVSCERMVLYPSARIYKMYTLPGRPVDYKLLVDVELTFYFLRPIPQP